MEYTLKLFDVDLIKFQIIENLIIIKMVTMRLLKNRIRRSRGEL